MEHIISTQDNIAIKTVNIYFYLECDTLKYSFYFFHFIFYNLKIL